ncbi:hypothetical protein J4410_07370 [Candidatus Woesearchaeota archaeon]|nr:hypothetical protein [Candidatus Woesearchaeota archaeon]
MNFDFVEEIFRVFARQPTLECTIRELSKKAKLSYNATHRTVEELLKKEFLKKQKYGNVCVISLNPLPETISMLSLAAYEETKNDERRKNRIQQSFALVLFKNNLTAITETKENKKITINNQEIEMMTVYEWIAEISKQNMTLKNMQILQGAEYLYSKLLKTL